MLRSEHRQQTWQLLFCHLAVAFLVFVVCAVGSGVVAVAAVVMVTKTVGNNK